MNALKAVLLQASSPRQASGASEAQLAVINSQKGLAANLSADDVLVRTMDAINDLPLKNGLRMDSAGVRKVVELAPWVPVLRNHDTSGPEALPVGRVFASRYRRRNVGNWGEFDFYMSAASSDAQELAAGIDSRILREVSIGFGYDHLECSICGTDMGKCLHWPMETYAGKVCEGVFKGVDALHEVSLVWSGMANGTDVRMAANLSRDSAMRYVEESFPDKPRRKGISRLFGVRRPISGILRGSRA